MTDEWQRAQPIESFAIPRLVLGSIRREEEFFSAPTLRLPTQAVSACLPGRPQGPQKGAQAPSACAPGSPVLYWTLLAMFLLFSPALWATSRPRLGAEELHLYG